MKRIVLATANAGKRAEFRRLLDGLGFEVIAQSELGIPPADEPHATFLENALAKARHAARLSGLPALADDSGLCVDALGGAPGVHSARFAGPSASDLQNNAELLRKMAGRQDRSAHYVCVLVAVRSADDPEPIVADARWHGEIVEAPRGSGGFGYDPLFKVSGVEGTAAELDAETKNRMSHRGRAMVEMVRALKACRMSASTGSGARGAIPIAVETMAPPRIAADVQHFLRPGTLSLTTLPPLSLYVHYPWCVRKCPYCDFNSHEAGGTIPETEYLDALRADLESSLSLIWGRRIVSVFIGGGTPSLLSAAGLDRLLSDVRTLLPLEPGAEITLEANPGTFEAEKFASFRASGVNRLSIGVQSFDEEELAALGRIHDRAQALAAVEIAQRHYDNFNLDLMYALPRQTLASLKHDVERAISFAPPHLSLYQLTLEPNTVFAKFPPPLPEDDEAAAMQEWIEERTATAGYKHYEISAYARSNRESRHNLNYWNFGDYLGIGAGAHSKLSFPHRIVRQVRFRQPVSYLAHAARGEFLAESIEVTRRDLPFEFMLNALRLTDGVPSARFGERTGLPPSAIEAGLERAEQRGLLARSATHWQPTRLGLRFLSDLQSLFLDEKAPK